MFPGFSGSANPYKKHCIGKHTTQLLVWKRNYDMPQEVSNRNVDIQEPTSISDVQQKPGHLLHEASHHSKSRVTKDPPCSLCGPQQRERGEGTADCFSSLRAELGVQCSVWAEKRCDYLRFFRTDRFPLPEGEGESWCWCALDRSHSPTSSD